MSFQKFIDLLINSQLYFCNLSMLTDKYEGMITNSNLIIDEKNVFSNIQRKINNEKLKHLTLVNCWTMQRHESYALWKIYGGKEPGVSIRTTVGRLRNSINSKNQNFSEEIIFAKVKYQNRLDDPSCKIEATITKREFYDFEKELRLIIFNEHKFDEDCQVPYELNIGRRINIDLNKLIEGIYISPFSNNNFKKNISKIIEKFRPNLKNQIRGSQIQDS